MTLEHSGGVYVQNEGGTRGRSQSQEVRNEENTEVKGFLFHLNEFHKNIHLNCESTGSYKRMTSSFLQKHS